MSDDNVEIQKVSEVQSNGELTALTKEVELIGTEDAEHLGDFMKRSVSYLKSSEKFNSLVEKWNEQSQDDKITLYNSGAISVTKTATDMLMPAASRLADLFRYDSVSLKVGGQFLAPGARSLIQLGLLPLPEGLNMEDVMKDMEGDMKSFNVISTAVGFIMGKFAPEFEVIVKSILSAKKRLLEIKSNVVVEQNQDSEDESPLVA